MRFINAGVSGIYATRVLEDERWESVMVMKEGLDVDR
jgi:hypothetical protein